MLYHLFDNHRPWHAHYFCALAFVPALIIQILFIRIAHNERTSGVCICIISIFSYLIRTHVDFAVLLNVGFLFLWGIRVCIKSVPTGSGNGSFIKTTSFEAAFSKTVWTWTLSAPTVFAVSFDANELPRGLPIIGGFMCLTGLVVDIMEKNQSRGRYTRNPYVFCSMCICWGLFTIHPSPWTFLFPLFFTYMLFYSHGGYVWSEAMRKENNGDIEYLHNTSPLIPLPKGVYTRVPVRIKTTFLCDF